MTASVILIPGIWMPRFEMTPLMRRVTRECGLDGRCFGYRSVRGDLDANAERLVDCIREAGTDTVHLVGHSLGGVLALHALARNEGLPPGRVVCLGSPLAGSRVAQVLNRHKWGRPILGPTLTRCVLERPATQWSSAVTAGREVGIIAGIRPMGFGRLFTEFNEDNDGTVAVAETRLPGATDHLLLPVTHTVMVLSAAVARQTAAFLRDGRFLRES